MTGCITSTSMPALLAERLREDAIALADEAIRLLKAERAAQTGPVRIENTAECMKITTRITHVMAWTLNRSAVAVGEITPEEAAAPERSLGECPFSDERELATLSTPLRSIAERSIALHQRAARQALGVAV